VRREIALKSGKEIDESKDEVDSYYNDDSDDSVLSLLSGLLATWSAERDGTKKNESDQDNLTSSSSSLKPKKSILKTSDFCTHNRPNFSVIFDSIIIREYERVVGDNPSCSRGPPISIGWSYVLAHQYPLDDYELLIKTPKRSKKQFHLNADIRTHLLVEEWDCSEEDIRKARREATYIQYCRAKSSFAGVRSSAEKEAAFLRKGNSSSRRSTTTADRARDSPKPATRRLSSQDASRIPAPPCGPPTSPRPRRRSNVGDLPPSINSPASSARQRPAVLL
jgi:hypothetical protein